MTAGGGEGFGGVEHALDALQFDRALDLVAGKATSELGARRVRELRPFTRADAARRALDTADEMAGFLMAEESWSPPAVPDAAGAIRRLGTEGSVLEAEEMRSLGVLMASSRAARKAILRWSSEHRRLAEVAGRLTKHPDLEGRVEKTFDDRGNVADGASKRLKEVRRELRTARNDLVTRLEEFSRGLPDRYRVPDGSVTLRAGRYCVPVRREGRSKVGGLVHDESASGQTLFVEPPLAIEPMNRIRELELEEEREVRRILEELTRAVRPHADELRVNLETLGELDSLFARAKYALEHGGSPPELVTGDGRGPYRVERGLHPLLEASSDRAVPFDLELSPSEKVLLVSGPNAGGKTVLLKSVGLLSALAQSGIVPPAGPDTRLPLFRRFFAVIGDEQSIEASLSTFSAQVRNLREIAEEADGASLVLVDEIGGNTDPAEGAALAAAFLLRMADQAGLTVATSHLGELKGLAGEDERLVNASLQFDAERLRPTYRLVRDRPGRSYALEIAERMGLPAELIARARSRLDREEREMEGVLAELQEREEELGRHAAEARRERERLEERARELEERTREVERREAEVEREAQDRTERYLLEAREEVEEAIRRLEDRYGDSAEETREEAEREEAASEARARVEEAIRERRRQKPEEAPRRRRGPPPDLEEGDPVTVRSLGREGRLEELRGEQAVVRAGGFKITVPVEELEAAADGDSGAAGEREVRSGGGRRPDLEAKSEVDLRGLRTDEVESSLTAALDAAIVADLERLRVIHGKGTGALRQRVREILDGEERIYGFRGGGPGEGGSGVTVVSLRPGGSGAVGGGG